MSTYFWGGFYGLSFPDFTRHFLSSLAETLDSVVKAIRKHYTVSLSPCWNARHWDASHAGHAEPDCSVRQDWMPLDGAFSLQSCALAYAFAQTVLFGMAKINISVIYQLPCVHNPWISTFFSVLPAPCAPPQEPCNRCSCVGDGDCRIVWNVQRSRVRT